MDNNMMQIFKIGDRIGGYCNGYFGRDDYDNKTCVFVALKYAVFENEDRCGSILNLTDGLDECVKNWEWQDSSY